MIFSGVLWASVGLAPLCWNYRFFARRRRARNPARTFLPRLFDIEKIADGVYAAVARPTMPLNCNAAIFEQSADILIVDAHSKPSAVAALVSQIRKEITAKPVRYVVDTHFHWDHVQGTPAYKRIAPHSDVVASEATRRLIVEKGASRVKFSVHQHEGLLESFKEKVGTAKSAAEKLYFERQIR